MLDKLFQNILEISISTSLIILILLLLTPFIKKNYAAKWRYFIWLFIAIRLIVPINFTLPKPPVTITAPITTIEIPNGAEITDTVGTMLPGSKIPNTVSYTFNAIELLYIIWTAGIFVFLLYQLYCYLRFKKAAKRWSEDIKDKRIIQAFNSKLTEMNINAKISLKICKKIPSPMMFGFFKPTLMLPTTDYTDSELSFILKHELYHYKRRDLWYKLLLLIANGVHWFNPLVYLMQRSANRDVELSCDDEIIKNTDIGFRKSYSETILNSLNSAKKHQTKLSTNFNPSKKSLRDRFTNIFDIGKKRRGIIALLIVVAIISSIGLLIACKSTRSNGTLPDDNIVITPFDELQKSVDEGHQPWRLNPKDVAHQYIQETLKIQGGKITEVRGESRVVFTNEDGSTIILDLYQPARKGEGGIWEVERWIDDSYQSHQVRDLTKLPPLFHNDDTIPDKYKQPIRDYIVTAFTNAYTPYYEVLGFEASNTTFKESLEEIEATFLLKMVVKNYYKDPDTVDYIKQAKLSGDKHYQILYDEYNAPKESNYELKVTADLSGGKLDREALQMYSNIAPKGVDWQKVEDLTEFYMIGIE